MRIFHIVARPAWTAATRLGELRPESLDTEGFVHCSFADQVAGVADRRFRVVDALCVVEIDTAAVPYEIRVEDSLGEGTKYPHVYGPIPTSAVVATHDLPRDAAGGYVFTAGG